MDGYVPTLTISVRHLISSRWLEMVYASDRVSWVQLLDALSQAGNGPEREMQVAALRVCAKAGAWNAALRIWEKLQAWTMFPLAHLLTS